MDNFFHAFLSPKSRNDTWFPCFDFKTTTSTTTTYSIVNFNVTFTNEVEGSSTQAFVETKPITTNLSDVQKTKLTRKIKTALSSKTTTASIISSEVNPINTEQPDIQNEETKFSLIHNVTSKKPMLSTKKTTNEAIELTTEYVTSTNKIEKTDILTPEPDIETMATEKPTPLTSKLTTKLFLTKKTTTSTITSLEHTASTNQEETTEPVVETSESQNTTKKFTTTTFRTSLKPILTSKSTIKPITTTNKTTTSTKTILPTSQVITDFTPTINNIDTTDFKVETEEITTRLTKLTKGRLDQNTHRSA